MGLTHLKYSCNYFFSEASKVELKALKFECLIHVPTKCLLLTVRRWFQYFVNTKVDRPIPLKKSMNSSHKFDVS